MKSYIVHDAAGNILRTGRCAPDDLHLQASGKGERVVEGEANDELHMVVAGRIVEKPAHLKPKPRAITYAELRAREYPPIEEQLDAIWKIINASGGQVPADASAVALRILEVKVKHPKP